jgi:hypothetical protein
VTNGSQPIDHGVGTNRRQPCGSGVVFAFAAAAEVRRAAAAALAAVTPPFGVPLITEDCFLVPLREPFGLFLDAAPRPFDEAFDPLTLG